MNFSWSFLSEGLMRYKKHWTLSFLLAIASQSAFSQTCEYAPLIDWHNSIMQLFDSSDLTIGQRAVIKGEVEKDQALAIQKLYEDYLAGQFQLQGFEDCLSGVPARQNFLNAMETYFYERYLDHICSAKSDRLAKLCALIQARYKKEKLALFRIVGLLDNSAPAEYMAGMERGTGFIYVDLKAVYADDWFIIVTHELLHRLDPLLDAGSAIYADVDKRLVKLFTPWLGTASIDDLPSDAKVALNTWLKGGLDRGILAEHRAWLTTYMIYAQGLADGLWKPVPWLEKMAQGEQCKRDLSRCMYDFLDKGFVDPNEGIFSRPLVQNTLQRIRQNLRNGGALPAADILLN